MSEYGALVTTYYQQQEAAAIAGAPEVVFTSFAVGDGGGAVPVLSSAGTGLVNQVYSAPVGGVGINNQNPLQVDIQCPLPFVDANGNPIGDFTVREVAIYDQYGKQVVAGITNFEKTTAAQGQSSAFQFIVSIVVGNTTAVAVSPPTGAFALYSDILDIDACMADLLALIVYNARRRLASERHAARADERAFQMNQRLRHAGF